MNALSLQDGDQATQRRHCETMNSMKAAVGSVEPEPPGASGRLGIQLWLALAIVLLCTAALAITNIRHSYSSFAQARQDAYDITRFRLTLEAAALVGGERGPTNAVIAEEPSIDSASVKQLAEFRGRTDAALAALAAEQRTPAGVQARPVPADLLMEVRRELTEARDKVDLAAAIPLSTLRIEDVELATQALFRAADRFGEIVRAHGDTLIKSNPNLVSPVIAGITLSKLRDYGGRVLCHIIGPIATNQPIPLQNLIDSRSMRGRILELWQLTEAKTASLHEVSQLAAEREGVRGKFLGEALSLVDTLIVESRREEPYSLSAAQLTERYGQSLKLIDSLTSRFMGAMIDRTIRVRDQAQSEFMIAAFIGSLALFFTIGIAVSIQRFLFKPLLLARDQVIALAQDRFTSGSRAPAQVSEIRRLFNAIDILAFKLVERVSLMQQLKRQAETDGLTGLMNRRAFDQIGAGAIASCRQEDTPSLILLDIDHFKEINDGNGHPVGDQVLKEVGQVMLTMLRATDIAARFGGEEFAILISGHPLSGAIALAEKLRLALQKHQIITDSGHRIALTASFGVARGAPTWPELIARADAALYRAKAAGRNCIQAAVEL